MSRKPLFFLSLLCGLASAQFAQGQNVFVLPPGDGQVRPVTPFTANPFNPGAGGIAAASDTFTVLGTPNGLKYYMIGRSGTDTVVVVNSSFGVTQRLNLGAGANNAAITPDGRYVVLTNGQVVIISTSSDTVVQQIDVGGGANDVAISRDGNRAFVTTSAGRVIAIDLNGFSQIQGPQNLGPTNGVAVGPNALVYVSSQNVLYELDPRDLSFRNGTGIPLNAQPGKATFAADGSGNIRAVMANLNPAFGGSSFLSVDLISRTVTPVAASGIILDRVVAVSGNRVFATSTSQQVYDISLPGSIGLASFSGLAITSGIRGIAASNELPSSRFLFLTSTATNTLTRIDLATNSISGSFPLSTPPGGVSYAGPTSQNPISAVYAYNNGQFINPSSQSLPLVIRAVDGSGRPVAGAPVQFSTIAPGAFIANASGSTDGEGYAQAVVIAPSNFGQFVVTATTGAGTAVTVNTTFTLTVGTGTTGATGLVAVRGGNGQVIRESAITPELLRVIVRDQAGTPIPNATVTWNVTTANGPNGSLVQTTTITDVFGETTNTYIAPILGPNLFASYVQSTITASTFSGSVNMYVTVIPNVFGQNPASFPTIQLIQPVNVDTIRGQVGTTLTGAIQVRITAGSGPAAGSAIPNVGVFASTGNDPAVAPTARCSETSGLSDTNGLATCDLVLGGKIGSTTLNITVGGQSNTSLNLILDPGLPGKIVTLQGDGQSGNPGQTLPLALLARIEDNFGNALPNANVTWSVDAGSATLLNSINRSDSTARVSTLVRLGSTPGPVRIRLTAQGGTTTATATFNLTVNLNATQIRRVSGDEQSAIVNTAFGEALVAQVLDGNGAGVPGVAVTFTVRGGSASLNTSSATSDANGRVSVNVTAGSTAGPVTISADLAGNTVSWNLTVRPIGPTLTAAGITNAATGLTAIAPGSIVTIRGTNIATGVRGYSLPTSDIGPRPTTLSGTTVSFGGVAAPIFWVANVDGNEAVTVQVPFDVPEGTVIPVTVTSNGTSATVNISIAPNAPGIFENTDAQGRRYAVATRADGSFITPDNGVQAGQVARVYVTGLGRTRTPSFTNAYGANQEVSANIIVGVNDAGVQVISAQYAQNLIGVYVVTFTVPTGTATGSARNLSVAVEANGQLNFSNGSTISIR